MTQSVLAIATSDNAPGGAILTFAFPIILFAIIGTVLYILLFSRPHPRVPAGHVALVAASAGATSRDAAADGSTTGGSVSGEADHGTTESTEASE